MDKNNKLLFITEDFPSGLNGTSVKTRNTLNYLLESGYKIDVCCFHFEDFKVHNLKHKNLKIHSVERKKTVRFSPEYLLNIFQIIASFSPISIARLFSKELNIVIKKLISENNYQVIIHDGYSTLQYQSFNKKIRSIYIDDEDFTDLYRQRFILERAILSRLFYVHEYLKSLIFEYFHMRKLNQIWAISPRTEKRLAKISKVKTVLMPTYIPIEKNIYNSKGKNLVFTGTLNWKENIDGLKWFISKHWHRIRSFEPKTKLIVIGQGASSDLISYLNKIDGVVYRGYVKKLETEYLNASLSISPVMINAGIKVKILTYMSYGLPVISTTKAAWGLVSSSGIIISTEKFYSHCVIILLRNKKLRIRLSKNAHANIENNYSKVMLKNFFLENLENNE